MNRIITYRVISVCARQYDPVPFAGLTPMAPAITRSRLALCSAPCKALRFAPPAHARGLRALTVPARSPSLGHCVMANGEWRLAGPTSIIDGHVERRYAAVIGAAFRHTLRDWTILRGADADRRPQGRDQHLPHTRALSRFAEGVSAFRTTRNRTRYCPQGISSRSSTEAWRYCWKREDSTPQPLNAPLRPARTIRAEIARLSFATLDVGGSRLHLRH